MKKIIYLLVVTAVAFYGCDPMEDINDTLDSSESAVVGTDEYTLTDDDYATLGLDFGSFDSEDQAKELLPDFLADMYPYWGEGSSVTVGYNLYIGAAEGVSDYTGADAYTLTNADYASTGSDAFGFYPNVDATNEIPDVLDAQIAGPAEGQIVLAEYKQYFDDPVVGLAPVAEYNFAGSMEGWTIAEVSGSDAVWTSQSGYVQGNGYFGGAVANEEWLVSPSIDLTANSNLKLQITQEIDFLAVPDQIDIMVSTNYSGDVTTATWTAFAFDKTAYGNMTTSDDLDFSAYDGQTITIAFKYVSSDTDAGRWRVASLAIKALGISGAINSKGEYFMYSGGSWDAIEDVYYLSSADYDSMGTGSGQPGQYNNFSSSIPADSYVPTFLDLTAPFAYGQNDDEIIVVYKYYSSSCSCTQTRGNLYTVIESSWTAHQTTIATTLQFGFEDGIWVPDNTIRYTLTNADYEYIGNALSSDPEYAGIVGTLLNYHDYDYNWSDAQIIYSLGVFLDYFDPGAEEGQKYQISYLLYDNGLSELTASLIKQDGEWIAN